MSSIVDLYAGPGGWSQALKWLGREDDEHGLEWSPDACNTAKANGFHRTRVDINGVEPFGFGGGLIASPPCPSFSMAGNGSGRAEMIQVLSEADRLAEQGGGPIASHLFSDSRTPHVLQPLRWALTALRVGKPFKWIALEQVPPVLPVWKHFSSILEALGYSVAAGNLQTEQYGVPQTRKRAIFVAKWDGKAALPQPTHSRYRPRNPTKLDPNVKPWVSMAEALGFGLTQRPSVTVVGGHGGPLDGGSRTREILNNGDWQYRASTRPNGAVRDVGLGSPYDDIEQRWLSSILTHIYFGKGKYYDNEQKDQPLPY